MSIRRPSWSGRKRRVGTGLMGSLSAAIARFASASSSADMSSKSISCSTSWGENVSTASSSISTFS